MKTLNVGKNNQRPPSMPDWVSKVICSKCKKKGHLAFNCPPKHDNKCIRSKSRPKIQSTNNESVAYTPTEFAGAATHFVPNKSIIITYPSIHINIKYQVHIINLQKYRIGQDTPFPKQNKKFQVDRKSTRLNSSHP